MLHWGLTAAALLLFAYAIRTVFVSSKEEGDEKKQKLGCGFALVATLLWIYVLNRYLESPIGAIRIGVGALLILPAVQAIAKPEGARVIRAAIALILAVLISGPPLRDLWNTHVFDTRPAEVRELADKIEELEELDVNLRERVEALDALHADVRAEIRATGKDWEAVRADPALLQRLDVLRRIDEERTRAATNLAKVGQRLPELRAALERVEEGEAVSPADTELDRLLRSMEDAPSLDELSIVEQHARQKELQELFEKEFDESPRR